MPSQLLQVDPERDRSDIVRFLSSEHWPFHSRPQPTAEWVEERLDSGMYRAPDAAAWWILQLPDDGAPERVGLISVSDLSDGGPILDIRIAEARRGRGIGRTVMHLLAAEVFGSHPEVNRIEGTTRRDNTAMQRAFLASGWVMEAQYREAWPAGERLMDAVGFSILRRDWRDGTVTPVDWVRPI